MGYAGLQIAFNTMSASCPQSVADDVTNRRLRATAPPDQTRAVASPDPPRLGAPTSPTHKISCQRAPRYPPAEKTHGRPSRESGLGLLAAGRAPSHHADIQLLRSHLVERGLGGMSVRAWRSIITA